MLTNEQRAHDITLSILQNFKNEILQDHADKANSTNSEVHFDYYTQSLHNRKNSFTINL